MGLNGKESLIQKQIHFVTKLKQVFMFNFEVFTAKSDNSMLIKIANDRSLETQYRFKLDFYSVSLEQQKMKTD